MTVSQASLTDPTRTALISRNLTCRTALDANLLCAVLAAFATGPHQSVSAQRARERQRVDGETIWDVADTTTLGEPALSEGDIPGTVRVGGGA